jgi:hypothetical protein
LTYLKREGEEISWLEDLFRQKEVVLSQIKKEREDLLSSLAADDEEREKQKEEEERKKREEEQTEAEGVGKRRNPEADFREDDGEYRGGRREGEEREDGKGEGGGEGRGGDRIDELEEQALKDEEDQKRHQKASPSPSPSSLPSSYSLTSSSSSSSSATSSLGDEKEADSSEETGEGGRNKKTDSSSSSSTSSSTSSSSSSSSSSSTSPSSSSSASTSASPVASAIRAAWETSLKMLEFRERQINETDALLRITLLNLREFLEIGENFTSDHSLKWLNEIQLSALRAEQVTLLLLLHFFSAHLFALLPPSSSPLTVPVLPLPVWYIHSLFSFRLTKQSSLQNNTCTISKIKKERRRKMPKGNQEQQRNW